MIAVERLVACALGELAPDDELEVEEHVLACDACAAAFAQLVRLPPAVAALVRAGGASLVTTRSVVDRLEEAALISRRYVLAPDAVVPCSVSVADVYALTTFHADLAGVTRLDLENGPTRLADIPFDARAGRVYLVTPSAYIRTLPSMQLAFRLIAVDAAGERTLGRYTLDHTASLPGRAP